MDITPFTISGIPRILFGEGRFAELPELVASFGRRALVVTGSRSFRASSHWADLTESLRDLGVSWDVVTVEGEPSAELVDESVAAYHERQIDVVLGIGGGSSIDAAKAIAGLLPFGNSVMDHLEVVGRGIPYTGPPTPCIVVPTTAGSGAEATKNAVLSTRGPEGYKRSFRHDSLVPKVALVDPVLTYGCSPDLTATSGMDAVTQLLESYVSTGASPFTDALALSGLAAAQGGLFQVYEGIPAGRGAMSYAALLSGITLSHAGLGVVHGLASPLGAYFPIPHGVACAALLAPATRMNIKALCERAPDSPALGKYAVLASLLSNERTETDASACSLKPKPAATEEKSPETLVSTLSLWTDSLRIPRLSAYGVTEADLPKIAAGCSAKTNPVALTEEELVGILRESL
ncbi:MAG: iron-containing alcohol dehydrogenase [Armatimonadota bacterium]|nr:iron-containing alcohol dehydrogenase [Armatimonadota bacterium]